MVRCLVVEDEKILRRGLVLTTEWDKLGCEVIGEAENGIEALEKIEQLSPDLVITDIRMPLLDGLELIEKAKALHDCEFLIISGFNEFEYAKKAIRLGVTEYITKPIDDDELYDCLRHAVGKILNKQAASNKKRSKSSGQLLKPITTTNKHIIKAINYIEQNYAENISVVDVCRALLISESYLTKLFKENTVYSFVDYLTVYRIEKACEMLKNPDLKIYYIAEKVGYKDQRYFSVLFKKIVGMTPKQYQDNEFLERE